MKTMFGFALVVAESIRAKATGRIEKNFIGGVFLLFLILH
jgi:hypothetical protein